jgi:class 3 adenylate cyclase
VDLDLDSLGLTEIIRLQNRLSEILRRRFTKTLALCFTDIVGSTAYFTRFGDEAGRRLQQRHFDLLDRALLPAGGRVVDTAGDGAFACFESLESAASALVELFRLLYEDNAGRARDEELRVRAGLHWGEVLADGDVVSGEAVNLCSRVAQTGGAMEIRLTREAFRELPNAMKLRCLRLPPEPLKGIPGVVEILALGFRDRTLFPIAVRVEETGVEVALPEQDTISFGRLSDDHVGPSGNDVVLAAADPAVTLNISRFHFELRRKADGFVLRSLTSRATEIDGREIPEGGEARLAPGSVVRVARVLTLRFVAPPSGEDAGLTTLQTL